MSCWTIQCEFLGLIDLTFLLDVDSIKDVVRSSMKVPEFDKHLKKAGGHIGQNIVEITIKMKTIVQKLLMIKIFSYSFLINNICHYHEIIDARNINCWSTFDSDKGELQWIICLPITFCLYQPFSFDNSIFYFYHFLLSNA